MISCDAKYFGRGEERAGRTTSHSVRIRLWVSERGARISSFALFRITRSLVRRTKNTAGAFHSKNEKPFAHGCKSAKNQLRSADMFCGLELICDTFAWYSVLVTTALRHRLTFGPIMRVFTVFSNYCYVCYFCSTIFLCVKPFTQHEHQVRLRIVIKINKKNMRVACDPVKSWE